jgi:hypothetical protein
MEVNVNETLWCDVTTQRASNDVGGGSNTSIWGKGPYGRAPMCGTKTADVWTNQNG